MEKVLFTTDEGSGAPVLCLHEANVTGASWAPADALGDRFRVLRWDAPGFGRSAALASDAGLDDFAAAACSVLDRLDEPAHLLGQGWGALIALRVAALRPELVRCLVLVGGTAGLAEDPELAARAYGSMAPGEEGVDAAAVAHAVRTIVEGDWFAPSRAIQIPTLVLCGDEDDVTGLAESQRVSASVPNAVFVTMNDTGHWPQTSHPETFEAWLRSFLYIIDHVRDGGDE